jgi:hypothetical protein
MSRRKGGVPRCPLCAGRGIQSAARPIIGFVVVLADGAMIGWTARDGFITHHPQPQMARRSHTLDVSFSMAAKASATRGKR